MTKKYDPNNHVCLRTYRKQDIIAMYDKLPDEFKEFNRQTLTTVEALDAIGFCRVEDELLLRHHVIFSPQHYSRFKKYVTRHKKIYKCQIKEESSDKRIYVIDLQKVRQDLLKAYHFETLTPHKIQTVCKNYLKRKDQIDSRTYISKRLLVDESYVSSLSPERLQLWMMRLKLTQLTEFDNRVLEMIFDPMLDECICLMSYVTTDNAIYMPISEIIMGE